MEHNDWLLTNNANDLIRSRLADADRRSRIPGDLPPTAPRDRRHQLASRLRRLADAIDN